MTAHKWNKRTLRWVQVHASYSSVCTLSVKLCLRDSSYTRSRSGLQNLKEDSFTINEALEKQKTKAGGRKEFIYETRKVGLHIHFCISARLIYSRVSISEPMTDLSAPHPTNSSSGPSEFPHALVRYLDTASLKSSQTT